MKSWTLSAAFAAALLAIPAAASAQLAAASGPPPAGTFIVHTIDVGTGLAVFVEGHDFTLLYDAGSNDDFARGAGNRVIAYLRAVRRDLTTIDHLILSHPHKDHVEMMDDVLGTYAVRNVWDSGALNPTCGYRAFLDAVVAETGVTYHDALGSGGTHDATFPASSASCHGRVRPGGVVSVPRGSQIAQGTAVPLGAGARMTILHADGTAGASHYNDASVVTRLDLGTRQILLAGDAEAGARNPPSTPPTPTSVEGQLLACCTPALRSDVLVVGHHGSMTSSRVPFLNAVAARHFVVSVGPMKYSGTMLPDASVITELSSRGTVWRTDLNDATCGTNPRKIGRDNDGKAGGCDNVRIVINPQGAIAAGYNRGSD